jgi:hypothetical protein
MLVKIKYMLKNGKKRTKTLVAKSKEAAVRYFEFKFRHTVDKAS